MINRFSDDWRAIQKWTERRIAELRQDNDADLSDIETANIRGAIAFAKELLELGKEKKEPAEIVQQIKYTD